jgi:FtsP/CotA-like multicopper oxidase with cupredoxin domain
MRINFSRALARLSGIAALILAGGIAAQAETRTYYVQTEEVDWNYAPMGKDMMMGMDFMPEQQVFVTPGPDRIGSVYHKVLYVGYTDETFTKKSERDPTLGFLGPIVHAEVGDTIRFVLHNASSIPVSAHPHGVLYHKDSEGALGNDGTSGADKADDAIPPGGTHTYVWEVPERAGPGPNDPSSVVWLYHGHVDSVADEATGMVGAIVITARGMARADGTPKDVDREEFGYFSVVNENQSRFMPQMRAKLAEQPSADEADEFEESNLMHSINGFVYANGPRYEMKVGEHVRWYVLSLGSEVDLHTPHWHGNTVMVGGHRKDVVELMPASTLVADMVADDPGIWMFHCHVNDHIIAGMSAMYEVRP